MDKLKMQSENLVDENVEKIAKLFPNCVTEGKDENGQVTKLVDFDLLKQELSKVVVDGNDERYTLNWAGKKQSILTANSPINATLRPCREESVDFDNTKNLYIEGDNLDVLKLLRETYLNKIKMIYIDPPYNTGHDFVYNDDFASSTDEYLQNSKSYDEDGNRMVQNLESNGRFHSDWLSMMFPRLKLAKDLLTDDGVIFISIDDNEQTNLKKICDEIFGGQNFVSDIIWRKKAGGANDSTDIAVEHEYIICYRKLLNGISKIPLSEERIKEYKFSDEKEETHGKYTIKNLNDKSLQDSKGLHFDIVCPDGSILYGKDNQWKCNEATFKQRLKDNRIVFNQKADGTWTCNYKIYLNEEKGQLRYDINGNIIKKGRNLSSIIDNVLNRDGNDEIKELFGCYPFSYPKPSKLIKQLLQCSTNKDSLILDFFSGSATTAHAVMKLNAEDGGNRKFIMVQLPELCDEKSEAYKEGYKNICEIGKERIRRAGKKIVEDLKNKRKTGKLDDANYRVGVVQQVIPADPKAPFMTTEYNSETEVTTSQHYDSKDPKDKYVYNPELLDIGFRVLKLDSSNMKDVYYSPSDTEQTNLLDLVSNIKEDRSPEDLLFQVMLDMGVILSSEIKTLDIKGKKVFNVNDGNLVCCFDENLTDEVVTEIAKMQPLYAVFRDSSMSSDSVAVNFDQIFETYSPSTTRKVL